MRSVWSKIWKSRNCTISRKAELAKRRLSLEPLEDRLAPAILVSVDGSGNLMIADAISGAIANNLTVKSDTTGAQFVISDTNPISTSIPGATGGGTNTLVVPMSSVTGSFIFVNTLGGDDLLTVDFAAGNFSKTLNYDGGAGGNDKLQLQGGGVFANVNHTHDNASSGSVSVTGNALISYAGLEPITDNLSATDRRFTFNVGSESILMDDVLGGPAMLIDSSGGEIVFFNPPTNSLTIDAGTGNDQISIAGYDSTFAASLILDGGTGDDTFNIRPVNSAFNGSLIIHGGANHDTVNFFNDMTFAANRILDVNLQDDPTPVGSDRILVQQNANYVLSGTGTATLKASAGISLAVGSSIITADGALILEGNGPGVSDTSFMGVSVDGATVQSTGSGAVQILGRGGVGATDNFGVLVMTNSISGTPGIVQSGTGALQVTGTGGLNTSGLHVGVYITGTGTRVGSTGGNVRVTGEGGAGSSSANNGVNVETAAQIFAGGAGTITVQGTGGTGGGPNSGVRVTAGGLISSANGNVQVTGVGRAGGATNGNNHGVNVSNGGQISAGGAGTVTVHGTAASAGGVSNHGVFVAGSGALITSNGGAIQVTGIQGTAGPSNPSFGINVTSFGGVGYPGNANVVLISDSINFDSSAVIAAGANSVTLRQRTNGTAINLGGLDAAGVLGLTDLELDRITASTINIGDANSGSITVSNTVSRGAPTFMNLTTGADINFGGPLGLISAPNATTTLSAPAGSITTPAGLSGISGPLPDVQATLANVDGIVAPGGNSPGQFFIDGGLAFSSTDTYRAQINGGSHSTDYDHITVLGQANLGSAILDLSLGFTPALNQPFVLIDTTAGVLNTFRNTAGNPLNEGATFALNGITFRISYVGGTDGRDVMLTALTGNPTIAISDASVTETNAGTTTMTFNVTLSAPATQTIAVNWATANGTATTADNDYVGASGTVPFIIGETSKSVTITVNGDVKFEPNETFFVNLSSPVGASIGDGQGVGTINNDDPLPTISVTGPPPVPEALPSTFIRADFTVTLSNPSSQTITVAYATGGGTATAVLDYASTSGILTFNPGQTSQIVSVNVFGDTIDEPDETFNFNLSTPTNATILAGSATATIVDDDPSPTISINDLQVAEGNSSTAQHFFTVTLSNPSSQTVSVSFATANGTALVTDNDYEAGTGTVTFNPGQTTQTVRVLILGDTRVEPDETFTVNLTNPVNSTIADGTGLATILNDDTPTISISDVNVTEGNAGTVNANFTVTLSQASGQTVTVNAATANDTAIAPGDYNAVPATLVSFTPGQTSQSFTVQVKGDLLDEINEAFLVNLSGAVNATILDGQGVGTINDDDQVLTLNIAKDWSFQTVDSAGDVGAHSSLAIGTDNRPRIAYEDRTTNSRNLKYASFNGAAWNIETVHDDPTDIVGQDASLVLDSLNRPHIAYQNFTDSQLRYAHHNGTSWLLEAAHAHAYLHNSIDVDSQNRPLISSYTGNTFDLILSRRSAAGVWSSETPQDTISPHGFFTSIAVDAADNPWIVFVDGFSGPSQTLKLARYDGTAWQFQTIDSATDASFGDTSLVLDSMGRPHVSYRDIGVNDVRNDLKYAFFNGTAWTITTVDANNAGEHNSLKLDSLNRPRIAYIGSGAARFASFDGNAWTTQFVGAQANYTSLALDQNDLASISYYSTATNDLVLASQVTASMSENGGSRLATVSRTDTVGPLTVNLLSNDTSEATVIASVVIPSGQTSSAPFSIVAVDDTLVDGTQIVTITASAAGYIADSDTVNVTDDDVAVPTVTLSLAGSPLAENGGVATVTATLSTTFTQPVTVNLGFTGTAANPADYTRSGTSIVIAAGALTGSITLTGVNDPTDEADETIIVDILSVTNGTESGVQQVTATITDDDAPPTLSISDATVTEGNTGTVNATFTVSLSQASGQTVTVNAATANNNAIAPDDYTAVPATPISFAPGQTSQTFTVQVQGDLIDEINETFFANLSGPSNATILDGQGVGTITDDDPAPSVSINDVTLTEGNTGTTSFVFTVSLYNPSSQAIIINFNTQDGTAAVADNDYQSNSGLLTFNPGQTSRTITVLVTGESKFEQTETFNVVLDSAGGSGNFTIADGVGVGTIVNDDSRPTISIDDAFDTVEGNSGTRNAVFTVSLSGPTSEIVTVDFRTANGTATLADNDYVLNNGTLTFPVGIRSLQITVVINGDIKFEPNESFFVNLSNATNVSSILDSQGAGMISNDDTMPTISINDLTLPEGNAGTTSFVFTVSLSNPSSQTVLVTWATANGTATTTDGDYQSTGSILTFAPGQTSQTVTVLVNGDTKFEPNETFSIGLSSPSGATIADATGVGTIQNDDNQPTISINDVSLPEGNSGVTTFALTVSLSNPSSQTINVNYATSNGTALASDDDYQGTSGNLTFTPGQTTQTINVLVVGDPKFEFDETFNVNLTTPVNATIADVSGLGTILNDDPRPAIRIDDVSLTEGNTGTTSFVFTVSLSSTSPESIAVNFATANGSATTLDGDYQPNNSVLNFAPGEASKTITVLVSGDTKFEPSETFTVELSGAVNATIADGSGLGTIVNDDAQPTISINDVSLSEGNSGTTLFVFTVSLSNASTQPISVNFATADGTATLTDGDYQGNSGNVSFAPGVTTQTITVLVNGDTKFEPDETFGVNLSAAMNATIADGAGLGTIRNDDSQPTISINDVSLAEGNGGATGFVFTVSLSNPGAQSITVNFATSDGSATLADSDFQGNSGNVTFAPGVTTQTITILVNGDTKFEPDETFGITLSAAVNATIADGAGLGTIRNDDNQPTISINDVSLAEGNSGTTAFIFTVSLSNPSAQQITVNFATANGSATLADNDYQSNASSVTFVPGVTTQTITVLVNGDTTTEVDETFTVNLSAATNATIADAAGLGTIRNDDGLPTLSINDVSLLEGNSGTTAFIFAVTLSNASAQPITVSFATADGTATLADSDYQGNTGNVLFAPGVTTQTITVLVNGDMKFEPDETFAVNLSAATGATIADGAGVGTIRNDDGQPTISISDASLAEGNSGTTAFVFTVSLSNASAQPITVNFATANGSATLADVDYQGTTGNVTFVAGVTTQTITVLVNGDTKFEPDETFAVNLSAATNATIADGAGLGTIRNDDAQPTITINDVSLAEGNSGTTAFVFTVSLSNPSAQSISVNFAAADSSATLSDNDYQGNAGNVIFAPGVTTQTITVLVNGDMKFEPDETFAVNLSAAVNATIADGAGLGTIRNDDSQPTISINDATLAEGNSGTTAFVFTVSLSNPSAQSISVNFATANGSATLADNDYQSVGGNVTFAPGTTTQTITVLVNGDTTFEPDETFTVNLSTPTNATIADATGQGTIRNDDGQPTISINDVTLAEGNSGTTAFVFTVSLSNPSAASISVNYAAANGSATLADNDFQGNSGNVTFAPGVTTQTITILVNGDSKFETDESFNVNLSAAVNATIIDGIGLGTIRNDDSQPTISVSDVSLGEGNSGTTAFVFTVSLSNPSAQAITVNFATINGSATLADSDFQSISGNVTFAPGTTTQTVTVQVNGDTKFESDETFTVNLSAPVNATITDGTGLGTIRNDDSQPTISINDVSRAEGDSGTTAFVFTVSLSNASSQPITVSFAAADDSATQSDSDYQAAGGELTFNPGQTSQTVTVLVNGDVNVEPTETFLVNLSAANGAAILDGVGRGEIVNDDADEPGDGTIELVNGVLTIRGTADNEHVHVNRFGSGSEAQIRVHANFLDGSPYVTFAESSITRIIILLGDGDDHATVAGAVTLDAYIEGEAGNDQLNAGGGNTLMRGGAGDDTLRGESGNDILVGGEGDDVLVGGAGRDLLIGGLGSDRLEGRDGDDILIGGFTDHDQIDSALLDIMREWTSAHSFQVRIDNLTNGTGGGAGGPGNGTTFLNAFTVHDDDELDDLNGGKGDDWLL